MDDNELCIRSFSCKSDTFFTSICRFPVITSNTQFVNVLISSPPMPYTVRLHYHGAGVERVRKGLNGVLDT
jgi:hypothetical protein